jgi:hypothetical protein
MAEKINKNERKNKADIITEMPGEESTDFWMALGDEDGMPVDATITVLNLHVLSFSNFRSYNKSHVMKYMPDKLCAMGKKNTIVITKHDSLMGVLLDGFGSEPRDSLCDRFFLVLMCHSR